MPESSKSRVYPSIPWAANDKKLVHELLDKLKGNDSIRGGIWPRKGERTSSHKKAVHHRNLADKLLKDVDVIKTLLKDSKARTHYGTAVKNQLGRLEKSWKIAKNTLGITGAGLPDENSIWDDPNEIRTKWDEVSELCPWFYKMRDLVGDRFDDTGAAIMNSETDVLLDTAQSGNRRRTDGRIQDLIWKMFWITEMTRWETTIWRMKRSPNITMLSPHIVLLVHTVYLSMPLPLLQLPQTPGTTRRKSGVMSDLTEGLKEVATVKNERKRLYDVGMEDTKRLEIREKYKVEQRRLDLEDKRMEQEKEIEMRKLALDERRLAMQIGEMAGGLNLFNLMAYGGNIEGNEDENMEIIDQFFSQKPVDYEITWCTKPDGRTLHESSQTFTPTRAFDREAWRIGQNKSVRHFCG